MDLIKISENAEGEKVVSARELHEFLEVKRDFTNWCKQMFEYGFEENIDYSLTKIGERFAHNKTDYALTLDTAKEIAMIQKTEKGKMARRYFIEAEKALRSTFTIENSPQKLLPSKTLSEWFSDREKVEYDPRTPLLNLNRFFRKPTENEVHEYFNIYEMQNLYRLFTGGSVRLSTLKRELERMGFEEGNLMKDGNALRWGYKVVVVPFPKY